MASTDVLKPEHALKRKHFIFDEHHDRLRESIGSFGEKRLEKLGMHASDTALLAFQDVRVPADAILGQEGKGFYHIMWELQGVRLIGAAGCVAGGQRCFDCPPPYALRRTP